MIIQCPSESDTPTHPSWSTYVEVCQTLNAERITANDRLVTQTGAVEVGVRAKQQHFPVPTTGLQWSTLHRREEVQSASPGELQRVQVGYQPP